MTQHKTIKLNWATIKSAMLEFCKENQLDKFYSHRKVYGVPRGGMFIAAMTNCPVVDTPEEADIIVDDLIDSGKTRNHYRAKYPDKKFYALYTKGVNIDKDAWLEFPWDADNPIAEVGDNVTRLLQFIGEDVKREGLLETPRRYVKFLKEFCSPDEFKMTVFENEGTDEMVIQKNIQFYSFCEHHMAPFFGKAAVAYIPDKKIVGISKLARTVDFFSRRLQNQERITEQVAKMLMDELKPKGVGVVLKARHLCVEMRGIRKPESETVTSHMQGCFKTDLNCRQEFLKLINY